MAVYSDDISAMVNVIYNYRGVTAKYVPQDGAELEVTVLFDKGAEYQPIYAESSGLGDEITIEVRLSEIGERPRRGDFFIIGNLTYYVDGFIEIESNEYFVKMIVKESQ